MGLADPEGIGNVGPDGEKLVGATAMLEEVMVGYCAVPEGVEMPVEREINEDLLAMETGADPVGALVELQYSLSHHWYSALALPLQILEIQLSTSDRCG